MANGTQTSSGRRFAIAVVLFLILSGVLMVVAGGSDGEPEVRDDEGLNNVKSAYEANVAIGRDLEEGNLGDAKKHNRKALDELRPLVLERSD